MPPVRVSWFWFALYIVRPIIAFRLCQRHWAVSFSDRVDPLPHLLRSVLVLLGVLGGILALVFLLIPSSAAAFWPWNVNKVLAQIYSGPMLTFAIAALLMAQTSDRSETVAPATGLFCFAIVAIASSLWHLPVLAPVGLAVWAWFACLTTITLVGLAVIITGKNSRNE